MPQTADVAAWVLCVGATATAHDLAERLVSSSAWPRGLTIRCASNADDLPAAPLMTLLLPDGELADAARSGLQARGWPYAVLSGEPDMRFNQAESTVLHAWARASRPVEAAQPRWRWICPDCDDGDCERHWLAGARREGG